VTIEPDAEARVVEVPADLAEALAGDSTARKRFEALSFTHRKEYVRWIETVKKQETRRSRIVKTVEMLRAGAKHP
jgi:uncharacterized protein YdeI (YjbR/CyaY-like superfamily)